MKRAVGKQGGDHFFVLEAHSPGPTIVGFHTRSQRRQYSSVSDFSCHMLIWSRYAEYAASSSPTPLGWRRLKLILTLQLRRAAHEAKLGFICRSGTLSCASPNAQISAGERITGLSPVPNGVVVAYAG